MIVRWSFNKIWFSKQITYGLPTGLTNIFYHDDQLNLLCQFGVASRERERLYTIRIKARPLRKHFSEFLYIENTKQQLLGPQKTYPLISDFNFSFWPSPRPSPSLYRPSPSLTSLVNFFRSHRIAWKKSEKSLSYFSRPHLEKFLEHSLHLSVSNQKLEFQECLKIPKVHKAF